MNIIVHEVKKDDGETKFKLEPRETENPKDDHANELSTHLTTLFRKTGLSAGGFVIPKTDDDPLPHFVKVLKNHFNGTSFNDFVAFSKAETNEFIDKLNKSSSSKGGYLLFNHYIYNAEHFLSIVLLRKKHGLALNNLTLAAIEQLDLDTLHMAARINLTTWKQGDSSKYIAFRIGRDAKDVTDYFSLFIGCEEYTKAKMDTKNLVKVTQKYCADHGFSDEKEETIKQFVSDQCLARLDNEESVLLDNLSTLLDTTFIPQEQENHGKFLEISQGEPYLLNNEVVIDKGSLTGLIRYKGRNKKMTLSFNSELLNKTVLYDKPKGELTFTEIPDDLKVQLDK